MFSETRYALNGNLRVAYRATSEGRVRSVTKLVRRLVRIRSSTAMSSSGRTGCRSPVALKYYQAEIGRDCSGRLLRSSHHRATTISTVERNI